MVRIQGQLSNNIDACVCLYVVDATSYSVVEVFWLSLRTKRDRERKKREKPTRETQRERETEEKKRKYFCYCLSVGIRFSSAFG